jgi:hypothetical protein
MKVCKIMGTDDIKHEAIVILAEAIGDLEVLENAVAEKDISIQKIIHALDGFIADLKEGRAFFDCFAASFLRGNGLAGSIPAAPVKVRPWLVLRLRLMRALDGATSAREINQRPGVSRGHFIGVECSTWVLNLA